MGVCPSSASVSTADDPYALSEETSFASSCRRASHVSSILFVPRFNLVFWWKADELLQINQTTSSLSALSGLALPLPVSHHPRPLLVHSGLDPQQRCKTTSSPVVQARTNWTKYLYESVLVRDKHRGVVYSIYEVKHVRHFSKDVTMRRSSAPWRAPLRLINMFYLLHVL